MSLHGGEPEGRRVGKLYAVWLALRYLSLVLSFPPSLSLSCLSCSFSLSLKPVAHKLIRSRCLLARDSHWPPQSRRSFCSLCRFSPFHLPSTPYGTKITLLLVLPNIRESYVAERSVERVNPRREDRRKGRRDGLSLF